LDVFDAVVIGAGVAGLSTAYNLAKAGAKVLVLEKGYAGSGSSTRNASGFRVHFNSTENTRFMIEGKKHLKRLSSETGINSMMIEDGYLWIVHDEEMVRQFRRLSATWSVLGVGVKFLDDQEMREFAPAVSMTGLVGVYGPQDGTFHHDAVTMGYQKALAEMGVSVREFSPATEFITTSSRVVAVRSNSKEFRAENFIVAAGAFSASVCALCGITLPVIPERRELGVTEPVKHFLKPFVFDLGLQVYAVQGIRGEVRCSPTDIKQNGFIPYSSTYNWTMILAQRLVRLLPRMRNMCLNRQWSGYYEVTPDYSHIMGSSNDWPEGIHVVTGFSGHGMMMGPLAGALIADHVLNHRLSELMRPYSPDRFKEGKTVDESMVF
jgi:sarcosine oxidase subunit beta